jgi:hypothetical protein
MSLIYHLCPATPNVGNGLIVMATQELIARDTGSSCDFLMVPAKGTHCVVKRGGIVGENVYDINQMGAGLLVGPGNLFENGGLEIEPAALDALQLPPLVLSVSHGRIFDHCGGLQKRSDAMPANLVRALCSKAAGILVRDQRTKDYLNELGISGAVVVGCPALALRPESMNLPPADPRATEAVLISVRNPLLMSVSPQLQGRVAADVRRLIDGLRSMGRRKIAILCHDPRDIRFAAGYPDVPSLFTEDPQRFLGWLRDSAINVGFRLHSLIACAVLGVPSVHFTYDERALGLIETTHLQACVVDYILAKDPVDEALALCVESDRIKQRLGQAESSWRPLLSTMRVEIQRWISQLRRHEQGL